MQVGTASTACCRFRPSLSGFRLHRHQPGSLSLQCTRSRRQTIAAHSPRPVASTPHDALAAKPVDRRTLLMAAAAIMAAGTGAGAPAAEAQEQRAREVDPANSPYIQDLLKKTEAMRETRNIQRLKDYDRRNFRDYFTFEAGSLAGAKARGINEETYNAIQKWLKENK